MSAAGKLKIIVITFRITLLSKEPAHLVPHWASIPKAVGLIPTRKNRKISYFVIILIILRL